MLKINFKRHFAILWVLVLLFCTFPVNALATEVPDLTVDENVAVTAAAHFVWGSLDSSEVWNDKTTIGNIIPLYDVNDNINAYCVNLITEGIQSGYVIVSTNINEPLIQEYSDEANDLNVEISNENTFSRTASNTAERIYYYGPLSYSTMKYDSADYATKSTHNNKTNIYREENEAYVAYLRNTGLICVDENSKVRGGDVAIRIESIADYLSSQYPQKTFTMDSADMVTSNVPGYILNGHNSCSLYGSAAMIRFHLGDGYTIEEIAAKCKIFAEENGYADLENGVWDYYIDVGSLAPFINKCIKAFTALDVKASSSLFSWATGTDEIDNNRPILLNIASSEQYNNHTVMAFGWCKYVNISSGSPSSIRFYAVKDAYVTATRFVNYETISISYITKVK